MYYGIQQIHVLLCKLSSTAGVEAIDQHSCGSSTGKGQFVVNYHYLANKHQDRPYKLVPSSLKTSL
jgi:hypothetical protein